MKRLPLLIAFLLLSGPAWAVTALTGTIRQADGTALTGRLRLTLSDAARSISAGVVVAPTPVTYAVTAGALPGTAAVYGNDDLQPEKTYYWAEYFDAAGGKLMSHAFYIMGATFDIGAAIPVTVTTSNIRFVPFVDLNTVQNLAGSYFCDQYAGATTLAKIQACLADVPTTGGTADLRGFEGAHTLASDPFSGITKPITLILGATTYTLSANTVIPATMLLKTSQGTLLEPATGKTLTINSHFSSASAGRYQVFGGLGTIVFGLETVAFPEWWGVDGTADEVQINKAIQAIPRGEVSLVGTYTIAASIITGGRCNLVLSGVTGSFLNSWLGPAVVNGTKITLADGANAHMLVISKHATDVDVADDNVTIRGILFYGNKAGQVGNWDCIRALGAPVAPNYAIHRTLVTDCEVRHASGYGIYNERSEFNMERVRVANSALDGIYSASGSDCIWKGVTAGANTGGGIRIHGSWYQLHDVHSYLNEYGIKMQNSVGTTLNNFEIDYNYKTGLWLTVSTAGSLSFNVRLVNGLIITNSNGAGNNNLYSNVLFDGAGYNYDAFFANTVFYYNENVQADKPKYLIEDARTNAAYSATPGVRLHFTDCKFTSAAAYVGTAMVTPGMLIYGDFAKSVDDNYDGTPLSVMTRNLGTLTLSYADTFAYIHDASQTWTPYLITSGVTNVGARKYQITLTQAGSLTKAVGYLDYTAAAETLGADLITNGDMEIDANWANYNTPVSNTRSNAFVHGGAWSREFTSDSDLDGIQGDVFTVVKGGRYRIVLWVYPAGAVTSVQVRIMSGDGANYSISGTAGLVTGLTSGAWNQITIDYQEIYGGAGSRVQVLAPVGAANPSTWYVDDVVLKQITAKAGAIRIFNQVAGGAQSFVGGAAAAFPAAFTPLSTYSYAIREADPLLR